MARLEATPPTCGVLLARWAILRLLRTMRGFGAAFRTIWGILQSVMVILAASRVREGSSKRTALLLVSFPRLADGPV